MASPVLHPEYQSYIYSFLRRVVFVAFAGESSPLDEESAGAAVSLDTDDSPAGAEVSAAASALSFASFVALPEWPDEPDGFFLLG